MKISLVSLAAATVLALAVVLAQGQIPQGSPTDLPLLSEQTPRGTGTLEEAEGPAAVAKVVDGDISDWVGEPSRYGGTVVYSGGELIYQDHLFDAHGPDDGRDAERISTLGPAGDVPGTYRVESLAQAALSSELGIPVPEQFDYDDSYGDATSHQDVADLEEMRVALQGDSLVLLARTTTMSSASDTALVLLADTTPGSATYEVPFDSGITTSAADVAFFIADGTVLRADLASDSVSAVAGGAAVAAPDGWDNALEVTLPRDELSGVDGSISIAIALGRPNGTPDGFAPLEIETAANEAPHANLANVAFRLDEPVRIWFDRDQALALHDRTIDRYFLDIDIDVLASGESRRFDPGQGYHDRIFLSDPSTGVPREGGRNGIFQHYGVYLPAAYADEPLPLQWWLHWRGGTAHSGGAIVPKVMKQFGEDLDTIVVAPSGRGTSTWYVGKGHVDVLEVWADVFDTFAVDRQHVYVSGHSMGGWGSYLLGLLYPDRFAGAAPVAGPVTQGGWVGVDCEQCWVEQNGSRAADQFNQKLLDNARHVPYAILQGTNDELVWYWAVAQNAARLTDLGYRHRFYTYPGYEHYSHPIADQWSEAAAYLHQFTAPENPAHVTYKRDMPFEIATEVVQSDGAELDFDFDSAYWMSGLTPLDMERGVASFDGRSLAIPEDSYLTAPDSSPPTAPGQTGPYFVTGLQWLDDPASGAPEAQNGFDISLEGAAAVTLDMIRMAIDTASPITGAIDTEHELTLGLAGNWADAATVLLDGIAVTGSVEDGVLTVTIPAGSHALTIAP